MINIMNSQVTLNIGTNQLFDTDYNECIICLEHSSNNVKALDLQLNPCKCNYYTHKNCIISWINYNSICPICKNKIYYNDKPNHCISVPGTLDDIIVENRNVESGNRYIVNMEPSNMEPSNVEPSNMEPSNEEPVNDERDRIEQVRKFNIALIVSYTISVLIIVILICLFEK